MFGYNSQGLELLRPLQLVDSVRASSMAPACRGTERALNSKPETLYPKPDPPLSRTQITDLVEALAADPSALLATVLSDL